MLINNKEKIRVVHIVQSPGGVERYLQMLFKYMNHERYENILIASNDYEKDNFVGLTIGFHNIDMGRAISPWSDICAMMKIRKLIQLYHPDVIYCHSSKGGALGRIANIGLHNKCIYNPHGWAFNMRISEKKRRLYSCIERLLAHFCSRIICISESEKQSAISRCICSSEKLQVIYNGIDFDEYQKKELLITREQIGIPKQAFVVGMVGRLSAQKAPDVFVDAARLIKEKIPQAYFLMVGDGEDAGNIRKAIADYGLSDSFLITGWVKNPMPYIEIFDVAMLLSRWEGFGLALPEYMIASKPIVATAVDAIPEVVCDHVNGLLVEVDDASAVAKVVEELYLDCDLRNNLSKNGEQIVSSKFNAQRVAKETEQLIELMVK